MCNVVKDVVSKEATIAKVLATKQGGDIVRNKRGTTERLAGQLQ